MFAVIGGGRKGLGQIHVIRDSSEEGADVGEEGRGSILEVGIDIYELSH